MLGATAHAAPRILVLGDSLSAAYGLPLEEGWVALLQQRLRAAGHPHEVVNASISGDTTRGGLARLPQALETHAPALLIVALGGNDGLRAFQPAQMADNLRAIIRTADGAGSAVLLVGIKIPANYGIAYGRKFHQVFHDIAAEQGVPLLPFLLEGVALNPDLMQPDGIHPNAAAQPHILANIWPEVSALLGDPPVSASNATATGGQL